jgi:hypothetical protein
MYFSTFFIIILTGKCGSLESLQLVTKHLEDYGIDFKRDVIGSTGDGARVMLKFGEDSPADYFICMNHGIHLAVVDVLYKNKFSNINIETCESSEEDANSNSDDDTDDVASVEENDKKTEEVNYFYTKTYSYKNFHNLNISYQKAVDETRRVVKYFRKSPLKNSFLQRHVKQEFNKEMNLILDNNTRWNSLEAMLERYINLSECVKSALIELNSAELHSESNIIVLKEIQNVLSPIKIAVEALSRKDATLLSSEIILNFTLDKLSQLKSNLSARMMTSLKKRIEERRNIRAVSLLKYLHNPKSFNAGKWFNNLAKKDIPDYAGTLMNRLYPDIDFELNETNNSSNTDPIEIATSTTLTDELNFAINNLNKSNFVGTSKKSHLNKEIQLFEATGKRTQSLELLYNALLAIKPTSTDSERAFSSAGALLTKLRSRMSDESMNAILLLKSFFSNQ